MVAQDPFRGLEVRQKIHNPLKGIVAVRAICHTPSREFPKSAKPQGGLKFGDKPNTASGVS